MPYGVVLGLFLILLYIYMPEVLQGKVLMGGDTLSYKGSSKEIADFKEETGEHTYWTNSLFGGMPSVMISDESVNYVRYVHRAFELLQHPVSVLFLTFLGFFLLLKVFGVNTWVAGVGGLAYAFASYHFIILAVGHNTKMAAQAYMAFVLLGIVLTFRRKYLLGSVTFGLALALNINANHPQITYYLLLLVLLYGATKLIETIGNREWTHFLKAVGFLFLFAILGVGVNVEKLHKSYDYSKSSIRGETLLVSETEDNTEKESSKDGLDWEYATEWSYGLGESFSFLIPNIKGNATNGNLLDKKSASYKVLADMQKQGYQIPSPAKALKGLPTYWGTQLFTEGPVYFGAIVCFFFFLGLFLVKNPLKWWLFAATLLSLLLGWGKNFFVFEWFFNYAPFFNKFRTPSMALVIAGLTVPLLGILGIDRFIKREGDEGETRKALLASAGGTLFFCLLFFLIPSLSGNFESVRDSGLPQPLQEALVEDRISLLTSDAIRSFIFILLASLCCYAFYLKKIKSPFLIASLALLILVDMWGVNKRFLNSENFVKNRVENYVATTSDKEILKDKDLSYRVLDLTENPFQSVRASYFHQSVGGYHAAKLRRYQDLIERSLTPELTALIEQLQNQQTDSAFHNLNALNMLNTRYVILGEASYLENDESLGNAWYVNEVNWVETPNQEIAAIGQTDVSITAILNTEFKDQLAGAEPLEFSGVVDLVSSQPNHLQYQTTAKKNGLVVFSEVYHKDWKAFVDGEEVPIIRANYLLRALLIPKGEHTVEFVFKPTQYQKSRMIGIGANILLLLAILALLFQQYKCWKGKKEEPLEMKEE